MTRTLVVIEAGSRLYGTATPQSDSDRKAVIIPDARDILLGRVKKALTLPTIGEGADAIQTEMFSLDFFLNLVSQGQTIAVEMLFAPRSAYIGEPDPLWLELIENRDRLLTRHAANFAGYCKRQAHVYGRKGTRAAAVRAALLCIQEGIDQHGEKARLDILSKVLEAISPQHRPWMGTYAKMQADGRTVGQWTVASQTFPYTVTLRDVQASMSATIAKYGPRALAAEAAGGIDYKAAGHSIRIAGEAIELLETGAIRFPRPDAAHLMDIRHGRIPRDEVLTEIDVLLARIEAASAQSKLPDAIDYKFVEDFLVRAYREAVAGPAQEQIADLKESLIDAAAHLNAATSAYEKFVGRQEGYKLRRGVSDPLFKTRYADFVAASDRATTAARRHTLEPVGHIPPEIDEVFEGPSL